MPNSFAEGELTMNKRIAINGFGRVGRSVLRVLLEEESELDLVAINDLTVGETLAQLFNFDSVYVLSLIHISEPTRTY